MFLLLQNILVPCFILGTTIEIWLLKKKKKMFFQEPLDKYKFVCTNLIVFLCWIKQKVAIEIWIW